MFKVFSISPQRIPLVTKVINKDNVEEPVFLVNGAPSSFSCGCYVVEKFLGGGLISNSYKYTLFRANHEKEEADEELGHVEVSCEGKFNPYLNVTFLENMAYKKYKHVGAVLHEVAFRASLLLGKKGFVALDVGYQSLLFHYACGFRVGDRCFGKHEIIPARRFDWDALGNDFKMHPQYGIEACLAWTLKVDKTIIKSFVESEKKAQLNKLSFNDVLAFYYPLYKNGDAETKNLIRYNLSLQDGVNVQLDEATIAAKKIEFNLCGAGSGNILKQ